MSPPGIPSNSSIDMDEYDIVERFNSTNLSDKDTRLFHFKKGGKSWDKGKYEESPAPESEIRSMIKRPKKETLTVASQWQRMSEPRKKRIQSLLDKLSKESGYKWDIVTIHNENQSVTKRTGEVTAFYVIVERTKLKSQDRGRESQNNNSFASRDISPKDHRPATILSRSPGNGSMRIERRSSAKPKILQEDMFSSKPLFDEQGKPINSGETGALETADFNNFHEDLGRVTLPPKIEKRRESKSRHGKQYHHDSYNLPAEIVGDGFLEPDDLVPPPPPAEPDGYGMLPGEFAGAGRGSLFGQVDNPNDLKRDRRERRDSVLQDVFVDDFGTEGGYDFMKAEAKPRSHSRTRPPKTYHYSKSPHPDPLTPPHVPSAPPGDHRRSSFSKTRPPLDTRRTSFATTHGGGRNRQSYHGSTTSESVLEAEIEEYTSSDGTSIDGYVDYYPQDNYRSSGGFKPFDGRYQGPTRFHQRGPSSPSQPRQSSQGFFDTSGPIMVEQRRPSVYVGGGGGHHRGYSANHVRTTSGASQDYDQLRYGGQGSVVPGKLLQRRMSSGGRNGSRSVVLHAHPSANLSTSNPRASGQFGYSNWEDDAEAYMREQELADRERDVAFRERRVSTYEQALSDVAGNNLRRKDSVGGRSGGYRDSKYTHEPRVSRRYSQFDKDRY